MLLRRARIGSDLPPIIARPAHLSIETSLMTSAKRRAFSALAALTMFVYVPCKADVPAPSAAPAVPAGYCTTIATELSGDLQAFNNQLSTLPPSGFPTLYAATLSDADGNNGPELSSPNYLSGVLNQLQELKALGVQAISVPIEFPILYEPFYGSQSAMQPYLTFYENVAQAVKAAGLKLIVDNEELFSNDTAAGWTNMNAFYAPLTWAQYMAARATMAATIVQYLQPNYLSLANEPDTEATQTGQQNLNNPADAAQMIAGEIAAVQAVTVSPLPQLGAGFGTWLSSTGTSSLQDYLSAYVALPLNYIDMHIIPVNTVGGESFIGNSLVVASAAATVGMTVSVGQSSLSKSLATEWDVLGVDVIRARGPFSFWAPYDASFLQTMQNLANTTNMLYVASQLPIYFFSYQTYGGTSANGGAANCTCTTSSCSDYEIMQTENALAYAAQSQPVFTSTAFSYYNQMVPVPDSTPPTAPATLSGSAGVNQANITWAASTDNVGIAGYNVYRCTPSGANQPCAGVFLASTTTTIYTDSTLTSETLYNYQVQAFDFVNNLSAFSPTLYLQTNRTTASAATGLVATAVSPKEINLSWSAPSDSTGLSEYLIYSGTSPSNLQQIIVAPSTATSYKNQPLTPATTYYYGVVAVEEGIQAAMSTLATATTMPLPPRPVTYSRRPPPLPSL